MDNENRRGYIERARLYRKQWLPNLRVSKSSWRENEKPTDALEKWMDTIHIMRDGWKYLLAYYILKQSRAHHNSQLFDLFVRDAGCSPCLGTCLLGFEFTLYMFTNRMYYWVSRFVCMLNVQYKSLTLCNPAQFASCLYSSRPFRTAMSQFPNFSLYLSTSWLSRVKHIHPIEQWV